MYFAIYIRSLVLARIVSRICIIFTMFNTIFVFALHFQLSRMWILLVLSRFYTFMNVVMFMYSSRFKECSIRSIYLTIDNCWWSPNLSWFIILYIVIAIFLVCIISSDTYLTRFIKWYCMNLLTCTIKNLLLKNSCFIICNLIIV